MAEEMSKKDRSLSLTIFATGGGLSPLFLAGNEEQKRVFLKTFLEITGAPLTIIMHNEPTRTANWLEKEGKALQTVSRKDED